MLASCWHVFSSLLTYFAGVKWKLYTNHLGSACPTVTYYQDAEIHWTSVMFSVQMLKSLFKEYGQIESIRFRSVVRYFLWCYMASAFLTLRDTVPKACIFINLEAGLGECIFTIRRSTGDITAEAPFITFCSHIVPITAVCTIRAVVFLWEGPYYCWFNYSIIKLFLNYSSKGIFIVALCTVWNGRR